jgi:hypothetical protein
MAASAKRSFEGWRERTKGRMLSPGVIPADGRNEMNAVTLRNKLRNFPTVGLQLRLSASS